MSDIYKQRKRLQQIVQKHNANSVTCYREEAWTELSAGDLIPGDVIELAADRSIVPTDCVLITGEAVVDEAMLTGESVPATKTPFF